MRPVPWYKQVKPYFLSLLTWLNDTISWGLDEGQDAPHPGDINQALIELGSTVCKVREPSCTTCPIQQWCSAYVQANNHGTGPVSFPIFSLTSNTVINQFAGPFRY